MKTKNLLILSGVCVLLVGIISVAKIPSSECCTCPPTSYKIGWITRPILDKVTGLLCQCKPGGECAPSFFVIPIELIILALIFLILALYHKPKRKND